MNRKFRTASNSIERRLSGDPWYAEGRPVEVAESVLRAPGLTDALLECLLSPDKGVSKRAAAALLLVCTRRPDLVQPYKEIVFQELERGDKWFVRYRLCQLLPLLTLSKYDIARASRLFEVLVEDSRIALSVGALHGLAGLALQDPSMKDDIVWLIERKMQGGAPAMRARGRILLKQLSRVR